MNRKFRGDRLKKARQYRGKTITELAALTGISKQSLSLYENGTMPDYERVFKIATELHFPYDYFMQEDSNQVKTGVTYFRSLASATKINRTAQSTKLEFVAKIYETLSKYVNFPPLNLPKISFTGCNDEYSIEEERKMTEEIESIARSVRKHWDLDDEPIDNMQLLLEENGIIITGFDVNTKIDAFSQRILVDDSPFYIIAVTQGKMPKGRIYFDMAHELAHILMHPWSEDLDYLTKDQFNLRERQANMFASAFLLPAESFAIDVSLYPTDFSYYYHLKKKWKCSVAAMLYRAHELNIISSNQFQYMMRRYSKNGWKNGEKDDAPYYLNENIFQGAIDLLFNEKVFTPTTLMKELNNNGVILYPNEIEELLHLHKGTLDIKDDQPKIITLSTIKPSYS